MTLTGINGYLENETVLVAVDEDLLDFLCVAALFTLSPYFLPRPAEVCGTASLNRQVQCFPVHKSRHKDLAGLCVLSYDPYQAVIIEFRNEFDPFFDILFARQLAELLNS